MTADNRSAHKSLLLQAGLALALSLLLRGGLAISANPVEGDAGYDVTLWLAALLQLVAVALFGAWAAVRALTATRPVNVL